MSVTLFVTSCEIELQVAPLYISRAVPQSNDIDVIKISTLSSVQAELTYRIIVYAIKIVTLAHIKAAKLVVVIRMLNFITDSKRINLNWSVAYSFHCFGYYSRYFRLGDMVLLPNTDALRH